MRFTCNSSRVAGSSGDVATLDATGAGGSEALTLTAGFLFAAFMVHDAFFRWSSSSSEVLKALRQWGQFLSVMNDQVVELNFSHNYTTQFILQWRLAALAPDYLKSSGFSLPTALLSMAAIHNPFSIRIM